MTQNALIIHEKQAHLEVVSPLLNVVAHESTLVQVFANLLNNALKFVAPGVTPKIRFCAKSSGAGTVETLVKQEPARHAMGIAPIPYQEGLPDCQLHHSHRSTAIFEG